MSFLIDETDVTNTAYPLFINVGCNAGCGAGMSVASAIQAARNVQSNDTSGQPDENPFHKLLTLLENKWERHNYTFPFEESSTVIYGTNVSWWGRDDGF